MGSRPAEAEILIVGAGPTGLALACALRNLGLKPLHFDKHEEGLNTSRAAVIHPRTMEVLENLGVAPTLLREGLRMEKFRLREERKVLLQIDFSPLPTAYPFALMIPQQDTERILMERLKELGGEVARGVEVIDLKMKSEGVEVLVRRGREEYWIHTRWLVGCDGGRSLVRQKAGITFEGEAYEQSFVLADVKMEWPIGRDEASLFLSSGGMMLVAPLPGNHFRIVATITQAPQDLSVPFFQSLVETRGPSGSKRIMEMFWTSPFHLQHRVASSNFLGRVLLCGDAAHVHSPAGGQGMNMGIQDAVSLAEPLGKAVEAGEVSGLGQWSKTRHRIAKKVVTMTHRMTLVAALSKPWQRIVRNMVLGVISCMPGLSQKFARKLSELDHR